ncbi:MAG: phosphate ABC transporter substrate-binding/OmpA family protein [Thalassolituus sp.]
MRFLLIASFILSFLPASLWADELFSDIPAGQYQHLFRIDGSNTIGAALAPALAEAWMKSHGVNNIERMSLAENETRIVGFHTGRNAHVLVDIAAHGSGTGFTAVSKGLSDIAAASRPVKAKEAALFRGVDLSSATSEHIVGIDGLAIITEPSLPVRSLTVDQLKSIFTGELSDWSEVGGPSLPISVFARDDKSGTWDSFNHMVLKKAPLVESAQRFESNDELSDVVSRTRGAIGFVGLASVRQAKVLAVSAGEAEALLPNQLTVATEDYALSRRLYMYTQGRSANRYAADFIDFVTSEGQKQVAAVGFVSQDIMALTPDNVSSLPDYVREQVAGAQRLSVNFRFKDGSASLDNKARRDIARLVEYARQHEGAEVLVYGHASDGDDFNRAGLLSRHRAMAVSRALKQAYVYPDEVDGFGADVPVARIEGNDGRNKNSRVEVWIRLPNALPQSMAGSATDSSIAGTD